MISTNLVVKNEEEYIERCLVQVLKLADEVLIVDTGSEDNTVEIIKKFPVKLSVENGEIRDIRNKLLKESKGDWLWFVDGDEIWPDKEIEKLKKKLRNTTARALSFTFYHFVGDERHIANHHSETIKFARKTPDLRFEREFPNERLVDNEGWITSKKHIGRGDVEFCRGIKFRHYGGLKKSQWRKEQPKKFLDGKPFIQ